MVHHPRIDSEESNPAEAQPGRSVSTEVLHGEAFTQVRLIGLEPMGNNPIERIPPRAKEGRLLDPRCP